MGYDPPMPGFRRFRKSHSTGHEHFDGQHCLEHWYCDAFTPFVTSLLDNHDHTLGYLKVGEELGPLMRKLRGSVAKLVNDLLPARRVPFWGDTKGHDYFDGCIRDELQCRRSFRYTYTQCKRHHVCSEPRRYPHTRVGLEVDRAVRRAPQLGAFLEGVPYARYERRP